MELKRCARCGKFYASNVDVCHECEKKDNADLNKLKVFFEEKDESEIAKKALEKLRRIGKKEEKLYAAMERLGFTNRVIREILEIC